MFTPRQDRICRCIVSQVRTFIVQREFIGRTHMEIENCRGFPREWCWSRVRWCGTSTTLNCSCHAFAICKCDFYQSVSPCRRLSVAMETKPTSLLCSKCGKQAKFITSILDPQTGKRFRVFECECGDRSCSPEK